MMWLRWSECVLFSVYLVRYGCCMRNREYVGLLSWIFLAWTALLGENESGERNLLTIAVNWRGMELWIAMIHMNRLYWAGNGREGYKYHDPCGLVLVWKGRCGKEKRWTHWMRGVEGGKEWHMKLNWFGWRSMGWGFEGGTNYWIVGAYWLEMRSAYGIAQWKCHMDVIFVIERLGISSYCTYSPACYLFKIKGNRTYWFELSSLPFRFQSCSVTRKCIEWP